MADVPKYKNFIASKSQLRKWEYCFLIGQQVLHVLRNCDKLKDKNYICWKEIGLTFGCDRFISSPTGR